MFDTIVWIAQGFLALFFLFAGLPKTIGKGIDRWIGFDQIPRRMTLMIGVCEDCAAVALVVPLLVNVFEWTVPLAALGIAAISLMASGFHLRMARGFHLRDREWLCSLETALWASLAGSIAIARWPEMSTAPSVSRDVLVPVLIVLVPAVIINLIIVTRATPRMGQPAQHTTTPTAV